MKIWPGAKSKPRSEGLLKREVDFAKHGIEPVGPLLSPKAKQFKAKRKPPPPASSPIVAPASPANTSKEPCRSKVDTRPSKQSELTRKVFSLGQVAKHLADNHPNCPRAVRKRIDKIAGENRWTGLNLAQLAFRSAEHYVLTEVCGIHRLIECGFDAASANRLVASQRKAVLTLWGF